MSDKKDSNLVASEEQKSEESIDEVILSIQDLMNREESRKEDKNLNSLTLKTIECEDGYGNCGKNAGFFVEEEKEAQEKKMDKDTQKETLEKRGEKKEGRSASNLDTSNEAISSKNEDVLELTDLLKKGEADNEHEVSQEGVKEEIEGDISKQEGFSAGEVGCVQSSNLKKSEENPDDFSDLMDLLKEEEKTPSLEKDESLDVETRQDTGGKKEEDSSEKKEIFPKSEEKIQDGDISENNQAVSEEKLELNQQNKGESEDSVEDESSREDKEVSVLDKDIADSREKLIENIRASLADIQNKQDVSENDMPQQKKEQSSTDATPSKDGGGNNKELLLSDESQNGVISDLNNLVEAVKKEKEVEILKSLSDETVQDIARPIIKAWLERNLEKIVHEMVEKEIKNIISQIK